MHIEINNKIDKARAKISLSKGVEKGEVYTKSEVVEFMLDIIGYTATKDLTQFSILEPSFGRGGFLKAIVKRLLESFFKFHPGENLYAVLSDCIRAVEISKNSFKQTQMDIIDLMSNHGINIDETKNILKKWISNSDFLLLDFDMDEFDYIVGNPPYIRQEKLSDAILERYKLRYKTIYDRADIYIPFIDRSLDLISTSGKLSFICSDRWVKNKYGKILRGKVSKDFNVDIFIDMKKSNAFLKEVTAYPSIFIISRKKNNKSLTKIPVNPIGDVKNLNQLNVDLKNGTNISFFNDIAFRDEPWLMDCPSSLRVLRKIESEFSIIENEGCRVGIGVASGNDKVYIVPETINVEEDRKLPILLAKDIKTGKINYKGMVLLNPFEKDGALISINDYPMLKKYFNKNSKLIKKRYVAKKNPSAWFRTIDKVHSNLIKEKKLLIPDIKGRANIVLDHGKFYPHHNLYYILSNNWEIEALQAILRSSLSLFFIGMYSVQMRGGYLRYQAQYLRRIRVPSRRNVGNIQVKNLIKYNKQNNCKEIDEIVFKMFGLDSKEAQIILKQNERVG